MRSSSFCRREALLGLCAGVLVCHACIPDRPAPAAVAGAPAPVQGAAPERAREALGEHAAPRAALRSDPLSRVDSADWSSYGHDLHNTRHNPGEAQIGVDNVAKLELKWSWETVAVTSTPVYDCGTLYFGDWQAHLVALDAVSGRQLYRSRNPSETARFVRGTPSVSADAVFFGSDVQFQRIERASGTPVWSVVVDRAGSVQIDSSLTLVGGLAIAGIASYQNINPFSDLLSEQPFQGSIVARDAVTGSPAWKFPLTTGRGVGVCSTPAIDLARKRLFVGTGENYDESNSPYADSLLALDYETGQYAWHRQYTARDMYSLSALDDNHDLDLLSSPILFTEDGVDMVAAGDKAGSFRAFDRDGKPLWSRQLSPGGHHGGVMGSPAYHAGVIYVCSGDFSTDSGDSFGQSGPARSYLFALDARDGSERWKIALESLCYGSVSHANGLAYLATGDGVVRAFDDASGRELWSASLGQSSAGGVSIAHGMIYVSYGWDWVLDGVPGGVRAYGLP